MSIAPEPYLSALLRVLSVAGLEARMIGYSGATVGLSADESKRLGDLADAVHNLPDMVARWEDFNEPSQRAMLADFDRKWGQRSRFRLLVAYEESLHAGLQAAAADDVTAEKAQ